MKLDGIVLDLDDTLIDTARLLLAPADRRAVAAMRGAGLRLADEDALARIAALRGAGVADVFRALAHEACAPADAAACAAAGERAFFEYEVPPLELDADVRAALAALRALAPVVVLTAGDPATQRRKVERLGLAALVDECCYADRASPGGKEAALRALLARRGWDPRRVVVAGDRVDGDVRAGNRCGCLTVLVRSGGEFAAVPPAGPGDHHWRECSHVRDLPDLLRQPGDL